MTDQHYEHLIDFNCHDDLQKYFHLIADRKSNNKYFGRNIIETISLNIMERCLENVL